MPETVPDLEADLQELSQSETGDEYEDGPVVQGNKAYLIQIHKLNSSVAGIRRDTNSEVDVNAQIQSKLMVECCDGVESKNEMPCSDRISEEVGSDMYRNSSLLRTLEKDICLPVTLSPQIEVAPAACLPTTAAAPRNFQNGPKWVKILWP
ncbi:hypothetical protein P7K49_038504 [Saguinus oedipus]|uniref:Uncharacterized protein n=1 Tax=Saguinus oedipus TaxID=9490 RepID=A0ABQ9TEV1_SAGOE|nr:hypothetical protein P7K49_038504 [Saguinus oedipus]